MEDILIVVAALVALFVGTALFGAVASSGLFGAVAVAVIGIGITIVLSS